MESDIGDWTGFTYWVGELKSLGPVGLVGRQYLDKPLLFP